MKLIYARQSIEKKDSISIESQIEKCIAFCTYNGWDYKIFKDAGYSGKDLNRPGFIEMMNEIEAGNGDMVICYRLDRISRSMADFSNLIVEFEKRNVKFVSVTENFDTSTPLGRAMVNIIMTFAQLERETIADRITDNYYARTKLGHWGGGPAPYGYKLKKITGPDGKKFTILEPDEYEADIVRKIYNWYLEPDGSVSKIIEKLNELQVPARGGSAGAAVWTSRVVSEILWRPLYAPNDIKIYNYFKNLNANIINSITEFDGQKSVNLYGKTEKNAEKHKRCRSVDKQYFIVSPHKPIVDSDTWLLVQAKKKEKKRQPARKGTGTTSVFTGLMKCGECGYSVSTVCDGKSYRGYICSTKKNRAKGLCSLPVISQQYADPIIFSDIAQHYSSDEVKQKIISAKQEYKASPSYLAKKNAIEMEIARIDAEIDNLLNSIAEGNTTVNKYINKKIETLDVHKSQLLSELNELELEERSSRNNIDGLEEIIDQISSLEETLNSGDFNKVKNMCRVLVKSITFHKDKSIEIEYYI